MENQPPKPITDVVPSKPEDVPKNPQPATVPTTLSNPVQTAPYTQSTANQLVGVHKAPNEPNAEPNDAVPKLPDTPQPQPKLKPQKSSSGVSIIVWVTIGVMILLSALAIFIYMHQNK